MSEEKPTLTIDIVSDVVCPWCIIGYKQLARAADMLADRADIAVRWHPFQLAPGLGEGGQAVSDYMRERYGATPEQGRGNRARIKDIGQSLGIDFRHSEESRIYNSHKAHQLLTWAAESGRQTALKLALFKAYFTDQLAIDDDEVLIDIVEQAGLDADEAEEVLSSGRYADAVDAEVSYWQDQNVTGVPAFVVNGKYMIPGAQDAETFAQVLGRVLERQERD
jgi:predicted DsbA family dithiol-disulfide isomerase